MKKTKHAPLQAAVLAPLVALFASLVPEPAFAADYFVATTGSDSAAGTSAAPFATLAQAHRVVAAGDTVHVRGGVYAFTGSGTVGVAFTKSGTAAAPIRWFAVDGETPVFDLTNLNPSGRVTGLDLNCSYNHVRGLEVKGVQQFMSGQDSWGVRIRGNNNTLERLNVHHNEAPGIFITSGANNLILNSDSHHNYDVLENGGSGDGFGCHTTTAGAGNVMRGCRGYDNSDDGYDFINSSGACTVEQSFAFRNGWVPDSNPRQTAGNGAGFKAGGYGSPPAVPGSGSAIHVVRQCVAFGNRSQGFYANHHPGRIIFYNNTAYDNATNFDLLADSGFPSDHLLRNNVALGSGGTITRLSGGSDTSNSWNLGVTVSVADFASVAEAEALAPRQPDGSLPNNGFMRLATGSDLIDEGVNVQLPFSGAAPDLGAFETGGSTGGTPGSGGMPGAGNGGAATVGGSPSTGGTVGGGAGAAGTPGGAAMGGASASGGAGNQAGSVSSSGAGASGSGGSGGVIGAGASGGSAAGASGPGESDPGGCSCRLPARARSGSAGCAGLALLGLALAVRLRRRRRVAA